MDHDGPVWLREGIEACLFDLDGVLTDTARVHETAWRATFETAGLGPSTHDDYLQHVDGRPREDGIRAFLAGAELLGVEPRRAAVFEDALAGVEAGRAGGFGLEVGVDRAGHPEALPAHGADVVVRGLSELLP